MIWGDDKSGWLMVTAGCAIELAGLICVVFGGQWWLLAPMIIVGITILMIWNELRA